MLKKLIKLCLSGLLVFTIAGCSSNDENDISSDNNTSSNDYSYSDETEVTFDQNSIPKVQLRLGDDGETFDITFERNETALTLVRNITSSGRRLPIYDYDNFEGYEYFQYYDIPSTYDIPSNPQRVTSQKAGEIYYSAPNRVVLFYQDANIEGMYTKIGEIENTDGLREAVENNPVLEGWGNKIINLEYVQ